MAFRTEPIIYPFLCLLKKSGFSVELCYKSIDGSGHDKSPKFSTFGIFNSASCAPVESGGAALYTESDGVPAIPVHLCHSILLYLKAETKGRG